MDTGKLKIKGMLDLSTNDAAFVLPKGGVLDRPTSPMTGMLRYNTDLSRIETWNGVVWTDLVAAVLGNPPSVLTTQPVPVSIVAGVITIDLSDGDFFYTTIDDDITDFHIVNASPGSTFIWQSIGTGVAYTQNFGTVRWPSGGSPACTVATGQVDTYVFIYRDDWFGYVSGQNS